MSHTPVTSLKAKQYLTYHHNSPPPLAVMLLSMTQYGKVKNRQNKRDEERKNCVKHKNNLHVSERKKRGALTDQMSTKIAKDTAFINFTRLLFIIHLVKSNMCGSGMVKRIVRFIYFC